MSTPSVRQPTEETPLGPVRIQRALLSVSDKTAVVSFAQGLEKLGIEIVSTGGTAAELEAAGVKVLTVEDLTGAPEILGGRVKTLHPKLHGGILGIRGNLEHAATMAAEGIEAIDLVCVNLYPFERTIARLDVSEGEAIEQIDIGGPTMIRAAAKNHRDVAVVVRPESYDAVLAELEESGGEISGETRHWLANEAFAMTSAYDAAISRWFGSRYEVFPTHLTTSWEKFLDLSYGENPHQRAAFYVERGARSHVLSKVAKRHGKDLSFNNVLDLDSAMKLMRDLEGPACVIVKHNNPCGAAQGETALEAYEKALRCDPLSAFGGVIVLNRAVDLELAEPLSKNFVEVLCAPEYEEDAIELLTRKEAVRILEDGEKRTYVPGMDLKRVRGGMLVQEADWGHDDDRESMQVAGQTQPTAEQWQDLIFAWRVCRHVRSNAIVLAKGRETVGIGAGQMSRVDSVRLAIEKARMARGDEAEGFLQGCVVASDAFFPFADGPEAAIEAGAAAVIQPGGSKRDDEVVAAADAAGVAMVMTGRRHFRH